jgi:hypothetical protein
MTGLSAPLLGSLAAIDLVVLAWLLLVIASLAYQGRESRRLHCPGPGAVPILLRLDSRFGGGRTCVRRSWSVGLEPEWRNGSAADL